MGAGPAVLCLHGFPDTAHTWRHTLPKLARAGYRAVAVALRGYETSSHPADGDYSLAALASDVPGWLDALGVEKACLVGHDWGANIAYAAAVLCPDRIDRLVTMAVPHPSAFAAALIGDYEQMRRSWYIYLFQLRGMAEHVVEANAHAFLKRLWSDWSPGWTDQSSLASIETAFAQPGVLAAALGYYRAAFDPAHPRAAETQRLLGAPVLARTLGLCGANDGCIGPAIFEASMPPALFPAGVRTVRIPNAGHFLHLEEPDVVNGEILNHLRSL
jgi:pimeloyl-ACP methyl ester carboxylesterase